MMKIAFYVLAATCLIGFSVADLSAFEERPELENIESTFDNALQDDSNVRIVWPEEDDPYLPTRPTKRPTTTTTTTPEPTTTTTTTTTTTPAPTTSTTTRRPRPTRPPRPTTSPRPEGPHGPQRPNQPLPPFFIRRPQIYNNRVTGLKPFASKLVNVVYNKGGRQRTIQRNQIFYNLRRNGPPSDGQSLE